MFLCAAPAVVALALLASPSRAEDKGLNDSDEISLDLFELENMRALRAEVDKALWNANPGRNGHLREYQVLRRETDPPRFFPVFGMARMIHAQVRCTLDTPGGPQLVDLDIAYLRAGTR